MMYSTYGVHAPDALPLVYPQDAFFDGASTQELPSQVVHRLSKGTCGQRAGTTAMRVFKPSSAGSTGSSPRSCGMSGRRRSMMGNDVWTPQRQQHVLDYFSNEPKQTSRPVSWHPSTYQQQQQQQLACQPSPQHQQYLLQQQHQQQQQQQQQQQHTAYGGPTPSLYGVDYTELYASQPQFSPMMTSYSNDTSPSSTFSPLPMYPASAQVHYAHGTDWNEAHKPDTSCNSGKRWGDTTEPFSLHNQASTRNGELDWNSFILHGFNNTTPPTPQELFSPPRQQPAISEPLVPLDGANDEEGEVLVGMGLYDTPDKVCEDPQLNNYRSTISSLLGTTYRSQEPKGKGLKLEETWEPPAKTDDDADGDDEED